MGESLKRRISQLEASAGIEPDGDREGGMAPFVVDLIIFSHRMMYSAALSKGPGAGPECGPNPGEVALSVLNAVRERKGLPPLTLDDHRDFAEGRGIEHHALMLEMTLPETLRLVRVQSIYFFWPKWGGEEGRDAIIANLEEAERSGQAVPFFGTGGERPERE